MNALSAIRRATRDIVASLMSRLSQSTNYPPPLFINILLRVSRSNRVC